MMLIGVIRHFTLPREKNRFDLDENWHLVTVWSKECLFHLCCIAVHLKKINKIKSSSRDALL